MKYLLMNMFVVCCKVAGIYMYYVLHWMQLHTVHYEIYFSLIIFFLLFCDCFKHFAIYPSFDCYSFILMGHMKEKLRNSNTENQTEFYCQIRCCIINTFRIIVLHSLCFLDIHSSKKQCYVTSCCVSRHFLCRIPRGAHILFSACIG